MYGQFFSGNLNDVGSTVDMDRKHPWITLNNSRNVKDVWGDNGKK